MLLKNLKERLFGRSGYDILKLFRFQIFICYGGALKQSHKTIALWAVMILLFLSLLHRLYKVDAPLEKINFNQFIVDVESKHVSEVTFTNKNEIYGQYVPTYKNGVKFKTIGNTGDEIFKLLKSHGVIPNYMMDEPPWWQPLLLQLGPAILLIALMVFFLRQLQVGGGKAMSFGKSRAKLLNEDRQKVTFTDVAGVDEAKDELQEIIDFLKDPKKFTRLGGKIPKGVLLMGPPGTGKTLLAKAIAGEAGVPFYSISGSDFVEMFVGVGASRVRDLFEQGKKQAPCIIFIDEIDAVGRHRGAGLGGGHDEREQTLNQLLVEMDGFDSKEGVILIAATNRPDVLDPALLRPGRFDRRVVVPIPDVRGREGILKVHAKRTPLAPNVDLHVIARGTPGFSGADLASLVNEAALLAARQEKDNLLQEHFEDAKDKVMMGAERRSLIMTEHEKRNTAYHESGHTLVATSIPGTDPVHKVTIIPRGHALGLTQQLPQDDRFTMTKEDAENKIAVFMGGRLAEELVLGHMTSGASNDFEQATAIARKMVCEWGMSEKIGPMVVGKKEEQIFLGKELSQSKHYSENIAVLVDQEIKGILDRNYQRAKKILSDKINILHNLASSLLENETLDSHEIEMLVSGKVIPKKFKQNRTEATTKHTDEGRLQTAESKSEIKEI